MPDLIPIILCGGGGTRLAPLSTPEKPKQFLTLFGDHSLLQNTVMRLPEAMQSHSIFVTNARHESLIIEQLAEIGIAQPQLILEPEGRNSAPAIAVAMTYVQQQFGANATVAILPADHHIAPAEAFRTTLAQAVDLAQQGDLVTFGIPPTHPSSEYGYIERGEGLKALRFVEKPDEATATHYLTAGNFYWNSGMFIFTAASFARDAALHMPEIWNGAIETIAHSAHTQNTLNLSLAHFTRLEKISIDYALFEKSTRVSVLPVAFEWSDLGSWAAVDKFLLDSLCF